MSTLSCSNGRFWRLPPFHSQRRTRNTTKEISIPSGLVDSTGGTFYRFPLKRVLTAGSLALTGDTFAQPRQRWMKAKALLEQSFSHPHHGSLKDKVRSPTRSSRSQGTWSIKCSSTCSFIGANIPPRIELSEANGVTQFLNIDMHETSHAASNFMHKLVLVDLDPATAKLAIGFIGPCLSAFGFLFILRIVMSWYPKLPVEKFPYVVAYAPTEPLLSPTRKLIPPLAGVDVTPVVWFGLISFLSEILVGPQGLLVLLSQQV